MTRQSNTFSRFLATRVREALADSPAVLIHGPRQSGKTTLARSVGEPRGYRYVTFDDDAVVQAARRDPPGFVGALPPKSILDEVQRVPEIFTSLKAAIDRRRAAGRYILTGSANMLFVPQLADSLAGRMAILRLHPLAQAEIAQRRPRLIETLFRRCVRTAIAKPLGADLLARIVGGGYPAALQRRSAARRRAWYREYIDTQIQRDVRDLSRLRSLDTLPRLLTLAASQTARLINVADLSAPFELTRQTIHDHITLLERIFLVQRLPPWHANRLSRLVKRPKLHITDTGVGCALLGVDGAGLAGDRDLLGQMMETFVLQELQRESSWLPDPLTFFHYRDRDDFEVDLVVQSRRQELIGIEVKAAASVSETDLRGLRKLRIAAGKRFVAGAVLYDGAATIKFENDMFAIPLRRIWEADRHE